MTKTAPIYYDTPEAELIPAFTKIIDDLSVGNNAYLWGPKGTGKTVLAESTAYASFGRREKDGKPAPFTIINCTQYTSPIEIKGGQTMEGYKEGALIEAWRDGKILILDEMARLDANTSGLLNDALAKASKDDAIIFNGLNQPIKKHPMFGCTATGNTIGKGTSNVYVGNNRQDASLMDRFAGSMYYVGYNEVLEGHLIYPSLIDMCWKARKAVLNYEGRQQDDGDSEDALTLRPMLNFQRIYILEMLRETGLKDQYGKVIRNIPNGKTLKDCFESYFMTMSRDKASEIKIAINMEGFYNSYKGKVMKAEFIKEYKRRIG